MISRIGNRELGLLCERVGVAFDVGHDPFRIFEREAGDGRSRHGRHMKAIADRIRQGASLTEAIDEQGNYFPPNFHRLIEVGEESGQLEKVLDRMAEHYKDIAELQSMFRASIVWPMIQLILAVVVVSVLIYVPSLLAPDRTEVADLLGIGLVGAKGLAIFWGWIAAIVAGFVGLWMLLRNGKLGFLGNWLVRIPVLGKALLTFDEATFVQSLALAIESGVTAANAVSLSFKGSSSNAFKAKADAAREAILQGREMHAVLRDTGLFSTETIEAVELGEESGRLAETLDKHFRVMRMRVKFAMAAIAQIASSVVWIAVAAILVTMIFRLFGRYVSQIDPAAVEGLFNNGNVAANLTACGPRAAGSGGNAAAGSWPSRAGARHPDPARWASPRSRHLRHRSRRHSPRFRPYGRHKRHAPAAHAERARREVSLRRRVAARERDSARRYVVRHGQTQGACRPAHLQERHPPRGPHREAASRP
jgi:type II secretory pathway component PulF